jgi:carbon storage regulator
MLILCRKVEESIIIGDNIEVKVVGISHNKVRLGVTAPDEVSVNRQEVYDAIQRGNTERKYKCP